MAEMMPPGMGLPPMPQGEAPQAGLPPDLELEAGQENPDGIFTQSPDFLDLPPEIAMQLVEMIRQLAQTGQLPPELAQGMPPGPMPQGMPQGMPAQPQNPMPMAPMMPQGMAKGGNVEAQESMEELHHQINTAKSKLKEIEKGIKESYAPQKKGSQGVAPNRPLAFAEGGEVLSPESNLPSYNPDDYKVVELTPSQVEARKVTPLLGDLHNVPLKLRSFGPDLSLPQSSPPPTTQTLAPHELLSTQTLGDPIGTANMRGPEIPATIISDTVVPGQPKMGYIEPPMTRKEDLPGNYWEKEAPHNPYLDQLGDQWPPSPEADFLAQQYDRIMQTPEYKSEIAKAASKTVPGYAKALGQAGRVLSHPATGAASSALGPLLSHVPVAQQYSGDMGQAIKRAGLQRAMELRPQMFAEPHMGPPKPKLHYDEAGWVVKKEPGTWDNLPQDPFQQYADMPQREWEKEMGFGTGTIDRGTAYSPSPFAFWNPPTYFPKTKEDLAKAWPIGRGPIPEHLLPKP